MGFSAENFMTILQAIILGIVQGLTEFLPVSSSGHLVLTQNILGLTGDNLFFDTMLHVGTLAAIFIVFWDDIKYILTHLFGRYTWLIVVATIPAVVAGFLLDDLIENMFGGEFLGFGFITTSILLLTGEIIYSKRGPKYMTRDDITFGTAFGIGCMQVFALLPGVSRSGSTLSGSLSSRVERNTGVHFAFMMSIPVVLGSALLQGFDIVKHGAGEVFLVPTMIGMLVAAVVGCIAGKLMLGIIKKHKLYGFSVYTFLLGLFVILDQFVLHIIF